MTTSGRDSLDPFLKTSFSSFVHYFSGIITYEDVNNHKPSPEGYKLALELSKKSFKNCIAIEDSSIGVKAAKAANLNCLLTLPPWSRDAQAISRQANACVNGLGNSKNPSKIIYGKKLNSNYVDVEYLSDILN